MKPRPSERRRLRARAEAKINWTLEVLGKRPDGFHEIRSVMQTISLADEITLESAHHLALAVDGPAADGVSETDNLVLAAARAFPEELARQPVRIHLTKHIPAAAGLGGGSSDAATTLGLLRLIWRMAYSQDFIDRAACLGSDVPFFLRGGAALVGGRGERTTRIATRATVPLVLVTPPLSLARKTAAMYAMLEPTDFSSGEASDRLADKLRRGGVPTADDYVNAFDRHADHAFPGLVAYREALVRATGARPMLAGAGPSLFAIVEHPDEAVASLRARGIVAWSAQTTVHTIQP